MNDTTWKAGPFEFTSRLMTGTGKYETFPTMREALIASGAEVVTVAVRRVNIDNPDEESLLDYIPTHMTIMPNTAGCATVEEAVRIARMAASAGMPKLLKLEVINDPETLLPDVVGTIEATKILVAEGFTVMPYTMPDPVSATRLVDAGAASVMPLASPIGSGRGFLDFAFIKLMIKRFKGVVPVIVDAGLGVPSDAAQAMEIGADAVLVNTAIARAADPLGMAEAFKLGVLAGRMGYLAGRIPEIDHASPSSPVEGIVK